VHRPCKLTCKHVSLHAPDAAFVSPHCRTWTARDAAGNTATATRTYAIVDDQDSILIGNIVIPVATTTAAQPLVRQTLSLGVVIPNKIYTWTVTPRAGVGGRPVTKTGKLAAASHSSRTQLRGVSHGFCDEHVAS
jgi:hypothetical protein